jgi:hypothetical protein
VRELMRCNAKYAESSQARADLQGLAGMGYGTFSTEASGPKGGRPPERFALRPDYLDAATIARRLAATGADGGEVLSIVSESEEEGKKEG